MQKNDSLMVYELESKYILMKKLYTKKQIVEAIKFWQRKLDEIDSSNSITDIEVVSINEDSHQFYCIDKNDEVVAKCKNPIGKIGISIYDDINAVGIGSFEIFKPYRRMGHAKNVLNKHVKKLKSKYSLVYCFVDKDNYPALSLYRQLGKVSNHLNANGQYEVRFWETTKDEQNTSSKGKDAGK